MLLIIDDLLAPLMVEQLKAHGFEAVGFQSSAAGLKWLETNEADLIILDLAVDELTGYEIAKEIRSRGIETKIIFITGHFEDCDEGLADKYGARIVQKPIKDLIGLVKGEK